VLSIGTKIDDLGTAISSNFLRI